MAEAKITDKLTLDLVTPISVAFSKPVTMAVVPGADGVMGILAHHAPIISTLKAGVVEIYDGNNITDQIFITGGFVEVTGDRCTVLAEEAIDLSKFERSTAEARLEKAKKAFDKAANDHDKAREEKNVQVAEALLAAVRH
ncbi:MAG: ATP synthase F1 subunit epsilon [Proteobacteria bacterium]|nr:ATP synthase F1 subunit epsilon [Pseudomonadota bacterium]